MVEVADALLYNPAPELGERLQLWPVATRMMGIIAIRSALSLVSTSRRDLASLLRLNRVTTGRAIAVLLEEKGWIEEDTADKRGRQPSFTYYATTRFREDQAAADSFRAVLLSATHNQLYQRACEYFAFDYARDPAHQSTLEQDLARSFWGGTIVQLGNQYDLSSHGERPWMEGAAGFDLLVRTSVLTTLWQPQADST